MTLGAYDFENIQATKLVFDVYEKSGNLVSNDTPG
jgi:hypothetical protein